MEQRTDGRVHLMHDLPQDTPEWVRRALLKAQAPKDRWFDQLEEIERDLQSGTNLAYNGGWEKVNERLAEADIETWMCTDTMVGLRAVLLDGRAVALSYKSARKNDTHFLWLNPQDAVLVRDLLRSIHDECEEIEAPEVASESPSRPWWGVQRNLMRPEHPVPVLVELQHPQSGERVQLDVQAMKADAPTLIDSITCMNKADLDSLDQRALEGATPGECFAEYVRVLGPVRAGAVYFAKNRDSEAESSSEQASPSV